jgi:hypothetical protein
VADPPKKTLPGGPAATLDVGDIGRDPEFRTYDLPTQRAILSRVDSEFRGMPTEVQDNIIQRLMVGAPTGAGPTAPPEAPGFWPHLMSQYRAFGQGLLELDKRLPGPLSSKGFTADVSNIADVLHSLVSGMTTVPGRALAGQAEEGKSVLSAPQGINRVSSALSSLLGGDPGKSIMSSRAGDYGGAWADKWGIPFSAGILGLVSELVPKKTGPIPTERGQFRMMQKIMGKDWLPAKPAEHAARATEFQTTLKQAAEEVVKGGDPGLKKSLPGASVFGGEPQVNVMDAVSRGNQTALDIAERAVDITNRPIEKVMETYGNHRVAPSVKSAVINELKKQAAATADDGVRAALENRIQKVQAAETYNDLNRLKEHANKEARALYGGNKGEAINASAQTVYAYKLTADAIRESMYPELQRLTKPGSGINLIELGKREADAITFRDGMQDIYAKEIIPDQANFETQNFLSYVFGGSREGGHSLYSRQIIRRGAEKAGVFPPPAGEFNLAARKAIGAVGEGATPETVTRTPGVKGVRDVSPKALPPGPSGPFFEFDVTTGPTREVGARPGTDTFYQGTSTHEPGKAQPRRVGYQESKGSPESTRYPKGEPREKYGAEGPKAVTKEGTGFKGTMWQRIMEPVEAPSTRAKGGGTAKLHTNDPKVAREVLNRTTETIHSPEFNKLTPEERGQLYTLKSSLQKQLKAYEAYKGAKRPIVPTDTGDALKLKKATRGKRQLTHPLTKAGRAGAVGLVGGRKQLPSLAPQQPPPPEDIEEER